MRDYRISSRVGVSRLSSNDLYRRATPSNFASNDQITAIAPPGAGTEPVTVNAPSEPTCRLDIRQLT